MAKILIVEDDDNMVSYVSTILLGAGHTCVAARSAKMGLELLDSDPDIRLVLLDQNLGDASTTGLNLLHLLRQRSKFAATPVIICTGDSRTSIVSEFVGYNIAGFIKKPFRPERLLKDVMRVLAPPAGGQAIYPRADDNASATGAPTSTI